MDCDERADRLGLDRGQELVGRDAERAQAHTVDVGGKLDLPGTGRGDQPRQLGCGVRLVGQIRLVPQHDRGCGVLQRLCDGAEPDDELPRRGAHAFGPVGKLLRTGTDDDDRRSQARRLAHAKLDHRLLVCDVATHHDDHIGGVKVTQLRAGEPTKRLERSTRDTEPPDPPARHGRGQ